MIYIVILFIIIFILSIFIVIKYSKNKKIDKIKIAFYQKKLKQIYQNYDKKHQIIDYDKLYHKLLLDIGYKGTFGGILKKEPKELDNLNKIWELHKLRNKLVHDFDLLGENILNKKAREYKLEFEILLKKVS